VKTKGVLVAIILVIILISSTAGCIIGGKNKVKAFVDAFHEGMKNDNSSTLKTWRETDVDKDTIRVMFTKENATSSIYYDLTIKCFQTATNATKFVDSINQGYMLTNSTESSSFANNSIYSLITGYNPIREDTYMRIDSIIPVKVSMIFQIGEIVMYGPGTIVTSHTLESTPTVTREPILTGGERVKNDFSLGTYVLYFWLPGCPPCEPMMTKINAIETQYKGTGVTVVKINIDENASSRDTGKTSSVTAAPTTIFIHNGKITDRFDSKDVDLSTLLNAVERARN
jgi:thiol-disulfide isomerase/thioredoxin